MSIFSEVYLHFIRDARELRILHFYRYMKSLISFHPIDFEENRSKTSYSRRATTKRLYERYMTTWQPTGENTRQLVYRDSCACFRMLPLVVVTILHPIFNWIIRDSTFKVANNWSVYVLLRKLSSVQAINAGKERVVSR